MAEGKTTLKLWKNYKTRTGLAPWIEKSKLTRSGIEARKNETWWEFSGMEDLTRILHILLQLTATVLVGNLGKVKIKMLSVTNAKILIFHCRSATWIYIRMPHGPYRTEVLMVLRVSKARPKIILRCQGVYLIMNPWACLQVFIGDVKVTERKLGWIQ